MAEYTVKVLGGGRIQLSYVEVVCSLDAAGWPEGQWATAAAVIAAESDRVCNIYNTYKKGHYGLMQMSASAHPAWFKSLSNPNGWVDPVTNCRGGLTLYRQSGYRPWEAYTNGRWGAYALQATAAVKQYQAKKKAAGNPSGMDFAPKLFRPAVVKAIETVQMNEMVQGVADAIGSGAETTGEAVSAAGNAAAAAVSQAGGILGALRLAIGAGRWLGDAGNWLRIVQVAAGGALLIGGAAIVARPAVQAGAKTVAAVTPVGKAVKGAGAAVGRVAKSAKGAAA